jgi:uncharacterized protein (DUF2336 family)
MTDTSFPTLPAEGTAPLGAASAPEPPRSRSRSALFKRLADLVCLPSSRVNAFERAMTADLLVEMLRDAALPERVRVARRLASLMEIPASLSRLLLRDAPEVAGELLEHCTSLSDSELMECARASTIEHRRLIAVRRGLGELVVEALVQFGEPAVSELLLRNETARLSQIALETLVAGARENVRLIPALLRRPEMRPSHAYVLFWWADTAGRRTILQRFAVSREVLQEAASDVFPFAAAEGWSDPLSRKALQFIERRQRNRTALERSSFASLDAAIHAGEDAMTPDLIDEISYLSGLKPMTGSKIFSDPGGEPLAILCKATGLPKSALRALWKGTGRSMTDDMGGPNAALTEVLVTYDMIAVDRAQTVLRYWNWALSSSMSPALLEAVRQDEGGMGDPFDTAQRAALLVL